MEYVLNEASSKLALHVTITTGECKIYLDMMPVGSSYTRDLPIVNSEEPDVMLSPPAYSPAASG